LQRQEIHSRLLARLLGEMKRLPGKELLKYRGDDGGLCDIRRHHVNVYVKQAMDDVKGAQWGKPAQRELMVALARCGQHQEVPAH